MRDSESHMLTVNELNCLASPINAEIHGSILRNGSMSIGQIAFAIGRSPKSLYYHIKQLCGAGLVEVTETRLSGKRWESVYNVVHRGITIDRGNTDEQYLRSSENAIGAMLRHAVKEFHASAGEDPQEDGRLVLRESVRLKPDAIAELRRMLHELTQFATANADPQNGVLVALTILLAPQPPRNDT